VLPAVMPQAPCLGVPAQLPAGLAGELPRLVPPGLPAGVAAELAAALAGPRRRRRRPAGAGQPAGNSPRAVLAARATCGELGGAARLDEAGCARLLGFLSRVSDPRGRRGRRHGLAYLLAIPVVAMMAGDTELASIGEWAAGAPPGLLAALGGQARADGTVPVPDTATITRALERADGDELDLALCAWTAALRRETRGDLLRSIHIDGKAAKGAARGRQGLKAPMLLSALCDSGTVVAQLPVNTSKTNEIPVFRDLIALIGNLEGTVVTADQMHTQRKHATCLRNRGAHYVFTIGENQPKLYEAVNGLPWRQFAPEHATVDRGHGRVELRTITVLPATPRIAALFPHAAQVFLLERHIYDLDGNLTAAAAVLGITSLLPGHADGAALMAYLRGHWSIEVLHHVRDVTLGEDASRARTASRALAGLRNLIISVLHLRGTANIAAQLRACHRDPYQTPLRLLGLASPPRPARQSAPQRNTTATQTRPGNPNPPGSQSSTKP
jgi:predicted transposase YbfD/YdcC